MFWQIVTASGSRKELLYRSAMRFPAQNDVQSSVSHFHCLFCHSISLQDVFLMIRRHKTTIFTDAKESTTVYELKRIVEGILKRPPEDQRLYKVNSVQFGRGSWE